MSEQTFLNQRVRIVIGDITTLQVDVIVNAANSTLLGGGGVDGAIHRAGGPAILTECKHIRQLYYPDGLPTGEAVITTGGQLPARYVIHTVGPVKSAEGDRAASLLADCYRNSLALAVQHSCTSIAFPAISTGVYGYPREEAAPVASQTIQDFLDGDTAIHDVLLVFFSAQDAAVFSAHHVFRIENASRGEAERSE